MSKNNFTIDLKYLGQCPKWNVLGWEARGMALELMGIGDDKYLGTISGDDNIWRSTLKIPSKIQVSEALKKSLTAKGMREQNQIEILWTEVWKVELLRWFVLVDENLIKEKPQYKNCLGRYWHPLLEHQNKDQLDNTLETKVVKKVARKKTARKTAKVKIKVRPEWDFALIRYTNKNIRDCWDSPLSAKSRQSLWDNAILVLGKGNEKSHRQFIGKLIKDYGEKNVAAAVAQLMVRPMMPADPKSFLKKTTQSLAEGSPAVKRARKQRAKVPL